MYKVIENMSDKSFDTVIRDMIKEETVTVSNRMNWLILLQGLLFAGYSNLSSKGFAPYIIGLLGFFISLCMRNSFLSNEKAIGFILDKWNNFLEINEVQHTDFPPVWAGAGLQQTKWDKIITAHRFIPIMFMIAWLAIIINTLLLSLGIIK